MAQAVGAWARRIHTRYFLTIFLSCFGFLTSFFRTLFPLPITGLLVVVSAEGTSSEKRETFGGLTSLHRHVFKAPHAESTFLH